MARQVIYDQVDGAGPGVLSTIDGILKEDYVMENITSAVNLVMYLLSIMQTERTTAGRRFVFPVQFGVSEGQGAVGENEPLPDEGFGEYEQAMGNVQYQYGNMYITGQSIEATEGGRASFGSALKQALKDVRDGFKLERHRMAWGDGSGVIALVDGAVNNDTVIPVTAPYGLEYKEADLDNSQKTRLFRRKQKLYFVTADQIRTVTAVNGDGTITVDSPITLTDRDKIVRGIGNNRSSLNKEIRGIGAGVNDTGTYLTIPRAGIPEWQANMIDHDGVPLSEESMQVAFDTAEINGTGDPDLMIVEHAVRRLYVNLLSRQKRIVNTIDLKGGFKALDYNGVPMVVDKRCPPQRIYYLRTSDWVWYTMKKLGWLNRDGSILKWVDGRDAWRAVLAEYTTMVTKAPANQTVAYNVTEVDDCGITVNVNTGDGD